MAAQDSADSLGSMSWIDADQFQTGGELHDRAMAFLDAVKWDVLAYISWGFRHGISCELSEKFSIGHFNMAHRIMFADGVSWVARLRMPEPGSFVGCELLEADSTLNVDVASITKTSVPVPQVHSHNADAKNDVGAPYILMDNIKDTVAMELRTGKECEVGMYGTSDQDFEIVGVIDFGGFMAAPIEVVASYPALTGLEGSPPGFVRDPAVRSRAHEKDEAKAQSVQKFDANYRGGYAERKDGGVDCEPAAIRRR